LPGAKDPDEFLRAQGLDQWKQQVQNSMPLVAFKLQRAMDKYKDGVMTKDAVLEDVLPALAAMSGELEKNEAVKMVAAKLFTSYHVVTEELQKFTNEKRKKTVKSDKIVNNKHNTNNLKFGSDFSSRAEYGLVRLILEHDQIIGTIADTLPGNFFHDDFYREIYKIVGDLYQQSFSYHIASVFDYLEDEGQKRLGAMLMDPLPGENHELLLQGYMMAIKRRQLLEQRQQLQDALAMAEKNGDHEEVVRLLREIVCTNQTLKGGEMSHEQGELQ
jgi:DNA primase